MAPTLILAPQRKDPKDMRLLLVAPDETVAVPDYVTRRGERPALYYCALTTLDALGSYEAKLALHTFDLKAGQIDVMLPKDIPKAIANPDVSPIDLRLGAKWELDIFGMLALQALLWIWVARSQPENRYWFSGHATALPDFEKASAKARPVEDRDHKTPKSWWVIGKAVLWDVHRQLAEDECLQGLIPASRRNSKANRHKFVVQTIRLRFGAFAPP